MEVVEISQKIVEKIALLEKGREQLRERASKKAITMAEYEKDLAIAILKLRNKAIKTWEEYNYETLPITLIEKVAKGICYQSKLNMEQAEAEYKNAIVGLSSIQAELNGFQSLNRYLEEV